MLTDVTVARVALASWAAGATLGLFLLGRWLARGGAARLGAASPTFNQPPAYFPVPLVLGHAFLATAGLAVWAGYVLLDWDVLAWVAFAMLLPIGLLGLGMFTRWLGSRRARGAARGPGGDRGPAESSLPVVAVATHGILAVTTALLVLAAALGIGSR